MAGRGSKFSRAIRGHRWEATRRAAFDRDGYRCRRCGKAGRLEAHHALPLHVPGGLSKAFDLSGILTYCRDCHIEHHRPPVDPEQVAWQDFIEKTFQHPSEGGSNHDKFTTLERSPERNPGPAQ